MPDDAFGIGQMVQAAVDFTKYFIGDKTNTSSNTSGTGWNYNTSSGETESKSVQNLSETTTTNSVGLEGTTGTSKTTNKGKVQNTTDPSVVAFMKSLMTQANTNANDPKMTEGVVAGITNTLRDAMTTSFGRQNQAGLYGSSSQALIENDLTARASADAAQAVLGYRTGQQRLAFDTASDLGKMLSAVITDQTSQTDTSSVKQTNQLSVVNSNKQMVTDMVNRFNNRSHTDQNMTTNQGGSTKSGGAKALFNSVVCTWMHQNGKLSTARYALVTADFVSKPLWHQAGYRIIATRLVRYLEFSKGKGLLAAFIIELFRARTQYVCASKQYNKAKKTAWGWTCRALIASICTPTSLYCYFREFVTGTPYSVENV